MSVIVLRLTEEKCVYRELVVCDIESWPGLSVYETTHVSLWLLSVKEASTCANIAFSVNVCMPTDGIVPSLSAYCLYDLQE